MSCNHLPFIVQVSKKHLFGFKSDILFLVVLPCPGTCVQLLVECVYTVRSVLLLLSRDELNPSPMSDVQAKQFADMFTLLKDLSAHSVKIEEGQSGLIKMVNDIKANQVELENKIEHIGKRIDLVETRTSGISNELAQAHREIQSVQEDNIAWTVA